MSEPQRTRVRVRRSPKIGVFLLVGVVLGALVAVVAVNVTPADATISKPQAIGAIALATVPIGAAVLGVLALIIDRVTDRRGRVVDAELISSAAPGDADAEPGAAAEDAPVEDAPVEGTPVERTIDDPAAERREPPA